MIKFRESKYSLAGLSRDDLVDILIPNAISATVDGISGKSSGVLLGSLILHSTADILTRLFRNNVNKVKNYRLKELNNEYLVATLNKYRYKADKDYVVNSNSNESVSVNLNNGILMICMRSGFNNPAVNSMSKFSNARVTEINKYTFISIIPTNKSELDTIINTLMRYVKRINIYEDKKL